MKIFKNISIEGSRNKKIGLDIFIPETNYKKHPVVIFAHGFKGFKDWGHFNLLAKKFCESGFIFLKFNFSYNGTSIAHPDELVDSESFGQNNLSTELKDLGCVIDFVFSNQFPSGEIFNSQLFLMGHSRGGAIVLLKAAIDERVKKVVSLASVNQFGHFFSAEILEQWKLTGVQYVENARTKQLLPMYYQYIDDLKMNKEILNVPLAIKKMNAELLIIHGTSDDAVNVKCAFEIKDWKPDAELMIIENANHTFGAKHPWVSNELPTETKLWFERALTFFQQ